jgi:transposase, IS5 family
MCMKRHQPGFFDLETRANKLTEMGDPLVDLKSRIDWEAFRVDLMTVHEKKRKNNAGAKPIDVVLLFQMLVLQHLYNLSDEELEYQVRDRLSFMRFLGLQLEDRVPDAKTMWVFRERLTELGLVERLFERFHEQLAQHGYVARQGQMVDATFIEVPRQRNRREENAQIKQGEIPAGWNVAKARQKDVDARWAKKNEETHYGYKNHINADEAYKLIQDYVVTNAAVHDSQVIDQLLEHTQQTDGSKRSVYADSAYRSQEREAQLVKAGLPSEICEKGSRGHPLTEEQKQNNRNKSKVRARVEHIFGAQNQMGGHFVRTIGIARATTKVGMMNLVYNMTRLVQLLKREAKKKSMCGSSSGELAGAPA